MSRIHEHMDGLRGTLVFSVLLAHTFFLTTLTRGPLPWYNELHLWTLPATSAASQFVIISGYCLMLPVAHSNKRALSGGAGGYLLRRLRRIVPPYYVGAILSLAHIYFFSGVYRQMGQTSNPFRTWLLVSHAFFFYNFNFDWRYEVNGSYWSLAPQLQLYLLFAIVLVPFWRRFGWAWTIGLSVVTAGGLMLFGRPVCDAHPWYLVLFVCGMAGAAATSSTDPKVMARRDAVPWARISKCLIALFVCQWVGVAVYLPSVFAHRRVLWQEYCFIELTAGAALLCAFMHWHRAQRTLPPERWPKVLRLLHGKRIMKLGRISYSLYLIHWPVLTAVIGPVRALGLSEVPTLLIAFAIAPPVAIAAAYLFFLGVERRFLPSYAKRPEPIVLAPLRSEQSA